MATFVADLRDAGIAVSPMAIIAHATDVGVPPAVVAEIAMRLSGPS